MAETVSGIVEKVTEQNSPAGAARKWTKKAFNINGDWYSAFVTKENAVELNSVNQGDAVEVTYETKGNFRNIVGVRIVAQNTAAPASTTNVYNPIDKDYRITYLASRRDAIEFVKAAVQLELVSLPTKKADKLDAFEDLVNEYASKFAEAAYVPREDRAIPVVDNNNPKEATDVE
jgi:hypothetical protein